ncbi:hypothetical protein ACNS7O_05290 [Haloferacaceae archaeon DSL9]
MSLTQFIGDLLSGLVEMPQIFFENIVATDPLSAIIWAVGMGLTTFSVLVMVYFAIGALGISLPQFGRGPVNR